MPSEAATALAILAASGAAVGAVQFLPPLTAYEAPMGRKDAQGRARLDELSYCRANLPGVDCGCFAQKAMQVMAQDSARVRGWSYTDRWDLALSQAADSCR
ncbi:hypothetical protein [Ponticoccus alexandrii]|uniref:Uncharacterized protein n=1 Tax=Ponticoccus alexandrii TaxID=1943633 RepID=A0ABX7F6A6_9RHOB|nr:hypothetical protein [Ponticoccus alexandrii]QRF65726.1 hypothetical protein GQA70_04965 [Ponticoccus alexandrii]